MLQEVGTSAEERALLEQSLQDTRSGGMKARAALLKSAPVVGVTCAAATFCTTFPPAEET